MLARHRLCHADECRRFNFKFPPRDWQCYPLSALSPDRRVVAEWATDVARDPINQAMAADAEEAAMVSLEATELGSMARSFCGPLGLPAGVDWQHHAGASTPH